MKKALKITAITAAGLAVLLLLNLLAAGFLFGFGPFSALRLFYGATYELSGTRGSFSRARKTIAGPNGTIAGYLFTPDAPNDGQLVILSHGFGSSQWANLTTAESLASAGIRVFSFDYCGGSPHAESEGKTTDMSILTECADLHAVLDTVKTWDGVDETKMALIGYSQGGLVAAITAAQRRDVERLCLVYPAFNIPSVIPYKTVEEIPETLDMFGMTIGKRYCGDILSFDYGGNIYAYCAAYENPVLILHGTADEAVPFSSSVTARRYYRNARLVIIEGAGHGFSGEDDARAVKEEYAFLTH